MIKFEWEKFSHSFGHQGAIKRSEINFAVLEREAFSPQVNKILAFRQQRFRLGVDVDSGKLVQEYWRGRISLHINIKEMEAAINTVKNLSCKNDQVSLSVDNQVIHYYLSKGGGRKNPFNKLLQPFFKWLMENNISLQVQWVPSAKCLADPISRWQQDRGDYSLDPLLFKWLKDHFTPYITLQTDLFASPGNKKLDNFVSRWPHWQATAVNALQCPLDNLGGLYANPPGP